MTVLVAGILTKCTGSNNGICSFQWLNSSTPIVDTIDTTSLNAIVIRGSGFSNDTMNNAVKIGDVACDVSSSSETEIICSAGLNPVGTYGFEVNVMHKGLATMNSDATVTFHLNATSISPVSSFSGGGIILNVTGTGFSVNSTVTIDGNACEVIQPTSYSLIRCIVPSTVISMNKLVDVVVTEMSDMSTVPQQFLYDYDSTPVVDSINPSILSVMGGEVLNISGQKLPVWPKSVQLGSKNVQVISSNSTRLVIRAPTLPPGLYNLVIKDAVNGNAHVNTEIEYKLYISSISPNIGSIQGGTVINVHGEGFSQSCLDNQVNFGSNMCRVLNCTNNWIQCQTPNAFLTHEISNDAMDPYYGKGYAWSKPHLTIAAGDFVHWSWSTPAGVTGVKFQVLQAVNSVRKSLDYGFNSGPASPKGEFTYQFNGK